MGDHERVAVDEAALDPDLSALAIAGIRFCVLYRRRAGMVVHVQRPLFVKAMDTAHMES